MSLFNPSNQVPTFITGKLCITNSHSRFCQHPLPPQPHPRTSLPTQPWQRSNNMPSPCTLSPSPGSSPL
ncbi:hypothetical protein BDQ17DRAFT_1376664 [Cyathus striatus]|nr:hypothetical protein BDQ17DRAFT_1376664 [Cyathus striatus]